MNLKISFPHSSARMRLLNTRTGNELSLNSLSAADLTAIIRSESAGIGKRRPSHDSGLQVDDDIFVVRQAVSPGHYMYSC